MLTRRVIVTLTLNEGSLYRTKKFTPDRLYTMNFVDMEMADEMVILDITRPGGSSDRSWLRAREFADRLFLPVAMGGGVCGLDKALLLMRDYGADKIVINTHAVRYPEFITELADKIGSQSVVLSVDVKDGTVWINQGQENTGMDAIEWVKEAEHRGCGEIYLMDIDRDGSLQGYNISLLQSVCAVVGVPVIISGGCGNYLHMDEAFNAGADACSTSVIFHFSKTGMGAMKEKLLERGHHVRMRV